MTLLHNLMQSVQAAAKVNRTVQTQPAAILWTDKDRHWETVAAGLRSQMPGLLTLGAFDGAQRTGPAIWRKCAIAGAFENIAFAGQAPVIYLPGISRTDLRAIESCPRALQPLAELQYRGAFWSQVNGKDWTVNAFLASKKGGLGCDVAQDNATQEALKRVVDAGLLLDRTAAELLRRCHAQGFERVEQAPGVAVGAGHKAVYCYVFNSW